METKSFVMYGSFHEALKELPIEQYGRLLFAINEYALNGVEPVLNGIEKSFFILIKPQLDANMRRRENGKTGGRPMVISESENQKPMVISENENQKPMVISENENQKPMVISESENQKPMVISESENQKPMVISESENQKPMVISESENQKPNVNVNGNVNENGNENGNENEKEGDFSGEKSACVTSHFVKPTLADIAAYCTERKNAVNARAFFDFYEAKNWYIGKNKMKDWQAAVRTWEQRTTNASPPFAQKARAIETVEHPQDMGDILF